MVADRPPFPPRPPERFPQRPPFRGPGGPGRPPEPAPPPATVRLRDGDREIDVSGSPAFVRQVLDDLPALIARLRGEAAPTPASIRMPSVTPGRPAGAAPETLATRSPVGDAADMPPGPAPAAAPREADSDSALAERIFDVLRKAARPLPISAIRERMDHAVTGQQVRRVLERAGSRVVASGERPMRYRLRG